MENNCDKETGIIDQTRNGECSNCGTCCTRYLYISEKEKNDIIEYCKEHSEVPGFFMLYSALNDDESITSSCPFRDQSEEECMIYDVRPQVCRNFMCSNPDFSIKAIKSLAKKFRKTDMLTLMDEIIDNDSFDDE